jgi:hypothetical protein
LDDSKDKLEDNSEHLSHHSERLIKKAASVEPKTPTPTPIIEQTSSTPPAIKPKEKEPEVNHPNIESVHSKSMTSN